MSDALATLVIGAFTLVATVATMYLIASGGLPRRKNRDERD